jgi:hypothetical protein
VCGGASLEEAQVIEGTQARGGRIQSEEAH